MLIYNGDVDSVCNFIGDEWFVWDLAKKIPMNVSNRIPWTFQEQKQYAPQIAGYHRNFTNGPLHIDLLTVKVIFICILIAKMAQNYIVLS